jgi:hypothetical protein
VITGKGCHRNIACAIEVGTTHQSSLRTNQVVPCRLVVEVQAVTAEEEAAHFALSSEVQRKNAAAAIDNVVGNSVVHPENK